jgi:hypothetical protein
MELKVRVWDNQQQKFFRPIYDASNGNLDELLISLKGDLIRHRITENGNEILEHESCFPNRFVKSMFTGLKDKNGKEIYCGDIVQHDAWEYPFEIFYDSEKARFVCKLKTGLSQYIDYERIKVIGNIYENKNLLKP